jgi:hypothetical protein
MSIVCLSGGFSALFYFLAEVVGCVCGGAVMNFFIFSISDGG